MLASTPEPVATTLLVDKFPDKIKEPKDCVSVEFKLVSPRLNVTTPVLLFTEVFTIDKPFNLVCIVSLVTSEVQYIPADAPVSKDNAGFANVPNPSL